jgi:hypothetical protein
MIKSNSQTDLDDGEKAAENREEEKRSTNGKKSNRFVREISDLLGYFIFISYGIMLEFTFK